MALLNVPSNIEDDDDCPPVQPEPPPDDGGGVKVRVEGGGAAVAHVNCVLNATIIAPVQPTQPTQPRSDFVRATSCFDEAVPKADCQVKQLQMKGHSCKAVEKCRALATNEAETLIQASAPSPSPS